MDILKKIALVLLGVIITMSVSAQQQKVAVYVTSSDKGTGDFIGAYLVNAITSSSNYVAVERTADFLKELKKEQVYQRTGSVEVDQISRLGKQFGVDLVCVASVGAMGSKQFVSARLIDVETATVKNSTKPVIFTLDDVDKSCAAVAISLISGEPIEAKKPLINNSRNYSSEESVRKSPKTAKEKPTNSNSYYNENNQKEKIMIVYKDAGVIIKRRGPDYVLDNKENNIYTNSRGNITCEIQENALLLTIGKNTERYIKE